MSQNDHGGDGRAATAPTAPSDQEAARPRAPGEPPAEEALEPRSFEQAMELVDELRKGLAAAEQARASSDDKWVRERAEVENFKRRMQREKADSLRYASEGLLRSLLPVIDNLERAVEAAGQAVQGQAEPADGALEGLVTGVEMVLRQFGEVLGQAGVTRVAAAGETFDPNRHEAVLQVESAVHEPGRVVDELQSGYQLHDRLLRPAQVSVAKAPADSA